MAIDKVLLVDPTAQNMVRKAGDCIRENLCADCGQDCVLMCERAERIVIPLANLLVELHSEWN